MTSMESDSMFVLRRFEPTADTEVMTMADALVPERRIYELLSSEQNVAFICQTIIERADPLRVGSKANHGEFVQSKVRAKLRSWYELGKFRFMKSMYHGKQYLIDSPSPISMLDIYNQEFIDAFAETIMPAPTETQVTSVVNPDGLYAQQSHSVGVSRAKPIPFYERSIFKRLHAFDMDKPVDETEMPFYRMDLNANVSEEERKKRNVDASEQESYLDRESLAYRMIPTTQDRA